MGAGQSTTRAYCPAGTRWNTQDINGTYFLVCLPTTQEQKDERTQISLELGIGLGLGIPLIIVCIVLLNCLYYEYRGSSNRARVMNSITNTISAEQIAIQMPQETVERELSAEALEHFRFGNLSPILMEELMILRVNMGQDLTIYVRYADICNQPHIADWIYRLNPGEIPREIREKAYRKIHPQHLKNVYKEKEWS
jgi:hypothetical protein